MKGKEKSFVIHASKEKKNPTNVGNQAVNIRSYNVTHTVHNLRNSTGGKNGDKETDVQTSY